MKCLVQLLCVISVICAVSARSVQHLRPARNGIVYYQSAPRYYKPGGQRVNFAPYLNQNRLINRRRQAEEHLTFPEPEVPQPTLLRLYDDQPILENSPFEIPLDQGDQTYPTVALVAEEEAVVNDVIPQPEKQFEIQEVQVPPSPEASLAPESPPQEAEPVGTQVRLIGDDDDDDDDDKIKVSKPGASGQTFFPIHFGKTSGGAIAIANSFSTGKGGSATSHSIAYGSSSSKGSQRAAT